MQKLLADVFSTIVEGGSDQELTEDQKFEFEAQYIADISDKVEQIREAQFINGVGHINNIIVK